MKAEVLIVDDDAILRRALTDRLRFWGHATAEAGSGEEALRQIQARRFDLVLLDLKMPGMSGMDVLHRLQDSGCEADVVVLTAHGSVEAAVEAIKAGALDFLPKPADFDLLRAVVDRSLSKRQLVRVSEALAEQHDLDAPFVVGTSRAMTELLENAGRAAESNATVLLRGESGTGKQVIAEHIHRQSPRAKGPFVYINCVALSDDLIESTLFGHEKGAFTGAVARKIGRIEAANGGTAFLDEIGDVSARLQTKLLHFLESGEFERVGGTQTIHVDCRIVAATNRDLEQSIRDGDFREDLFYRLNVITLQVPPLRERSADIPTLAEAFVARYARELKRGPMKLAARTAAILQEYAWPGNIRQLKNACERMVVMARTDTLTPDLLPPELHRGESDVDLESASMPLKEAMLVFKKRYLGKALARTGGNQTKAAEQLGIQRSFLNRLMKELKIRPGDEAKAGDDPQGSEDPRNG
jgi:DNA-binding NtrC family response regulator